MFTLLSGLWRYMFQKDEYYILILGLDNVGKTVCGYDFMYKFKILGLCFASSFTCFVILGASFTYRLCVLHGRYCES